MTEPKLPTLEELSELAGLHEAATPGPWHHDGHAFVSCGGPHASGSTLVDCSKHVDADYIAAARNAIPGLLAAARRGMELERRIVFYMHETLPVTKGLSDQETLEFWSATVDELGFPGLGNKGDGNG